LAEGTASEEVRESPSERSKETAQKNAKNVSASQQDSTSNSAETKNLQSLSVTGQIINTLI